MDDLKNKEKLSSIIKEGIFEKYIILKRDSGPGKVKEILDKKGKKLLTNVKKVSQIKIYERGG
jgi:stage III sporulation protein AA